MKEALKLGGLIRYRQDVLEYSRAKSSQTQGEEHMTEEHKAGEYIPYPENWHEEDEQVMKDLMRADMKMSGVQTKWVGLTDEEVLKFRDIVPNTLGYDLIEFAQAIEAKLRSKNT